MSPEQWRQVRIANVNMRVPVFLDEETTERIAQEVDACIARIEAESTIIDTQKFALLAAFSFAVEKHALLEEQDQDTRDLVKALESLASRLKALAHQYGEAPPRS